MTREAAREIIRAVRHSGVPSAEAFDAVRRNGLPVVGFGQAETLVPPTATTAPSLWTTAILTSVVGGATSWVVEEIAKKVRGKRR